MFCVNSLLVFQKTATFKKYLDYKMKYNTLHGIFNCWLGVTFPKCIFCGQLVGVVEKKRFISLRLGIAG